MDHGYLYEETSGLPLKMWTRGVSVEDVAREQLHNVAAMPFIHKHVAVMPDVHWGMGAAIGSVIATKGAVIPAAVGVDIGCGMMAVRTDLTSHNLPESLGDMRRAIELLTAVSLPEVKGWKECARLGRAVILANRHVLPDLLSSSVALPISADVERTALDQS